MEQRGTRDPASTYLPYWHQALREEIGVLIECTERRLFVQRLYEARTAANDPRLEALMIFQPGEGMVFIAKKQVELDP
jgi:hypothetical protein